MTVQRYRRKPAREDREDQYAARYEPGQPPVSLDNPKAVGAPANWHWGYLPCGCRNDGHGNHVY